MYRAKYKPYKTRNLYDCKETENDPNLLTLADSMSGQWNYTANSSERIIPDAKTTIL
jgi:hypothetical protein